MFWDFAVENLRAPRGSVLRAFGKGERWQFQDAALTVHADDRDLLRVLEEQPTRQRVGAGRDRDFTAPGLDRLVDELLKLRNVVAHEQTQKTAATPRVEKGIGPWMDGRRAPLLRQAQDPEPAEGQPRKAPDFRATHTQKRRKLRKTAPRPTCLFLSDEDATTGPPGPPNPDDGCDGGTASPRHEGQRRHAASRPEPPIQRRYARSAGDARS